MFTKQKVSKGVWYVHYETMAERYSKRFTNEKEADLYIEKSNSLLELKKYSIDEIENYLDTIGYSIIKTTELDYLEEKLMNHTG